jgi:hypothetical protein
MIALVLSLALASCDQRALASLSDPAREAGCALLEQPAPASPELPPLASIYERPGFERARERNSGALQAWLAQARAWLARLFESTGAERYSSATRVLVLALALAFVLGAGLRWRRRREPVGTPVPHASTGAEAGAASWRDHLAAAERERERAPREALRLAALALVAWLEASRLARPDRVKTNRELVGELAARGATAELSSRVEALLTRFDERFYSLAPISPNEAQDFVAALRGLTGSSP